MTTPEPRLIGYARVSSEGQNLDRQLGALTAQRCHKIYSEKMSGKDIKNRPQLEKAIASLGTGDILMVAEWDRATRSMWDGLAIMQRVAARGAFIKILDKPHLDLTTPLGRGLLALLSAMAEDERERILERSRQGMAAAKARGVRMGRKPELTKHQQELARSRVEMGESLRVVARDLGVSHTTIARTAA